MDAVRERGTHIARNREVATLLTFSGLLRLLLVLALVLLLLSVPGVPPAMAAEDSCGKPLVMLVMSRDEKLFYKAYNDLVDLDEDGTVDSTYKDSIDYYGYFAPNICYTYANSRFEPSAVATGTHNHYCSSRWSGNFLNWAAMARIDILRKALYGGKRSVDTATSTVLTRTKLPRDAHSWAKAYNGSDISSLTPVNWGAVTICNTNTSKNDPSGLMYAIRGYYPYAANTEGFQCTKTFEGGDDLIPVATLSDADADRKYAAFNVDVKVCDNTVAFETNCRKYGTGYKPDGLLQTFGVNRHGTDRTADDTASIYFGLISGSYSANASGGVLRSVVGDLLSTEVDSADGTIRGGSKIIANINNFQVIGYNYNTGWYDAGGDEGTCVPSEPYILTDGECKSWGNPIGEMLYETIRYFQGRTTPTAEFSPSSPDRGISNLTVEAQWCDPYTGGASRIAFQSCAKPFALIISDIFPNFDSDQLPGSYWPKTISTNDVPGVQTLMNNSGINTLENISDGVNLLAGQSGATFDRQCTLKSASDFARLRGLCIEEPTKQGSYYIAGLANYARTTDLHAAAAGDQKMVTYAVATESIPAIRFSAGGNKVTMLPVFHDGCPDSSVGCGVQGTGGDNSNGRMAHFGLCPGDADWTAKQAEGYTMCYDVMWDDAEYGWDYDLDISVRHYIKTSGTTVTVKTQGFYAATGHTGYAGYYITGVSSPGNYYDIRCGGSAGFGSCQRYDGNASAVMTRTFTATGISAGPSRDPLWYAAKYGGFIDGNGNNRPDIPGEWDKDGDGVPDTYFYAPNPLKLEEQLNRAFTGILDRSAAPTAPAQVTVGSGGGGGGGTGCFIATAAYGSSLHPYVAILREFRDRILLASRPGAAFVGWYYRISPPIAETLSRNTPLKAATRILLLPLIGFSILVLKAGLAWTLVMVFMGGVLIIVAGRTYHSRKLAGRLRP